jgi:hypothetical protein
MSISVASASEFFRCIGSAIRKERHAAFATLVRLLIHDARRPRPAISLPGRPAAPPPTAPPLVKLRSHRRAIPQGKMVNAPSRDGDAREPYSRRRLKFMNRSFVKRLERAIANGQERPHVV